MFKLAATVMGSVFLGLVFATIGKSDPPTESATLNSNQVSVVQNLIDSSVRENIKPILDRLDDLDRRTRGIQSSASSDQEPPPLESRPDKGSPCWPSTCERAHDTAWPCPGSPSCRGEHARHIDIHLYKHIYVHKRIYKPVYWRPAYYRPPWDDCGW
jgi:hypothetical protein